MTRLDAWVDFNGVNDAGWVETLVSYARPGLDLEIGAHVVVGDDEGTVCEGTIIGNDGAVLRIALETGNAQFGSASAPEVVLAY
jgi:hypothetical protein